MSRIDSITIRWASSADEIPESLWERCFPPPVEGRWWYRTLDRCGIGEQFTFAYAVLEQTGNPVGIAPTFVMDVPVDLVAPPLVAKMLVHAGAMFPRLRYQRTLFVGSPVDEGTVGLVAGTTLADVAPVIQDALVLKARDLKAAMIVWKDFTDDTASALDTLSRTHGLFRLTSYPGTRLALKGSSFESYVQALRSNSRYKLRKKLSLSRGMGKLETSVTQSPDDALLGEVFGLFWQTYERGKNKFERLTPEFFKLIAAEPVSYFVLLSNPVTGKLVAFSLCFRTGKRVVNKFIGLDYAYRGNWFLFFRLWEQIVDWAARSGAEELQSGQTGYMAKLDVGHTLIPQTNYCRHLNPVVHRIFKAVASSISWSTLDDDLKQFVQRRARN
jgi:hypothetical protein